MKNPLKTLNELIADRADHARRLLALELARGSSNKRLAVLEKETVTLEELDRLIDRVDALEKKARAPIGLDGPVRVNSKGYIAPGGLKDRILCLLREESGPIRAVDVAQRLNEERPTVQRIIARLYETGRVERRGRGLYCLPQPAPARSVGQRNGK